MKNLMTRKIAFGLLMSFVLAFGVQGTADALTLEKPVTGSGDLSPIAVDSGEFSIQFIVTLEDSDAKYTGVTAGSEEDIGFADGSNQRAAPDRTGSSSAVTTDTSYNTGDTHYYETTTTAQVDQVDGTGTKTGTKITETTTTRTWVTESDAYYHNEEAVQIDIPSGITLTDISYSSGASDVTLSSTSDVTLTEAPGGDDNRQLVAATITVEGYATSTGEKTISIRDRTPSTDRDGDSLADTETYTIYVTRIRGHSQSSYAVPSTASVNLNRGGVTNGVGVGYFGRSPVLIYDGDSNHYPVRYTVTNGTIYAQKTVDRKTTSVTDGSFSTSSAADVYMEMGTTTTVVTALVDGAAQSSETTAVYIFGFPTLEITEPGTKEGTAGTEITDITAKVKDGTSSQTEIGSVPVKFEIVNPSTGALLTKTTGTVVDSSNNTPEGLSDSGTTLHIRTDSSDGAVVKYEIGTAGGEQIIRVSAVGQTTDVKITNTSISARQLSVKSEKHQTGGKFDIIATVTQNEMGIIDIPVTFTTVDGGELAGTPHGNDDTTEIVKDTTNAEGEAVAIYDPGTSTGDLQILVSIPAQGTATNVVANTKTIRKSFFVRGGRDTTTRQPPVQQDEEEEEEDTTPTGNTISVSTSSLTGGTGEVVELRVLAGTATVTVTGDSTFILQGGLVSGTGTTRSITLPTAEGFYSLTVSAPNYDSETVLVTVSGAAPAGTGSAVTGTLSITLSGARSGNQQAIQVTAQPSPSSDLTVTLSGATNPPTLTISAGESSTTRVATLPTTTGAHTLRVSADGYNPGSVTVPAVSGQPPPTTGPVGEADSLEIDGQRLRSGIVNEQLDAPLRVRVIDANSRGVSGVRVTFRVLKPARGTFAGARGKGNAILGETDRNGYTSANFTPTSAGDVVVQASASGVSPVTFILDVNGVPEGETDTRTPGPSVTPSREISPVVHIGAANRPPMLWVDGGAIYALVGKDVQEFGSGVDGAMNVAIGDGKVYWTEQTGESAGTINSANLNGTGVKELKSIRAVPMGIAVDTASSKLYWTNSRGRIQSANLDGSGITNVRQNLSGPMDIAVARGNLYWTQYDATAGAGSIGIATATGRGTPKYISTGSDMPGSLVVHNSKVYWTEMTGANSGTINSANLNGSGATQLASILAVPSGIAVDGSRSKLYWTNSRGRIQSANLNGKKIQSVVGGLGMPGDMVLSNSIAAPVAGGTSTGSGTTASKSKYDVNGDGTVDSADVDELLLAVLAELTNAKYDVNGDGAVDVKDVRAVNRNLDPGAASAPTLLGMKLSAIQIDRLQEQIDLLLATGDRSPAAIKTLIYLQQLIALARPEKTQLLANYPNPFNPETWIPYELATDTNVRITIYNTHGVVIRTLELGHQSAGYYTGRERAAYWDGRNALGEQVASGIYFYQFETDDMSSMRKMVILK